MSWLPPSRLLAEGRADDHPVAVRGGDIIPFARFRADVAATTLALRRAGCRRGGLLCGDGYLFTVGLLALAHAGTAIVVPPSGQPGLLTELAESWDLLVTDDVVTGSAGGAVNFAPLVPRDVVLDFFTSGSTSRPKRVRRDLAQIEAEIAMLDSVWGSGPGPVVATVPHQHVYGLAFRLLWPLAAGRPFAAALHEVWETLLPELVEDAVLVSSPAHLGRLGGLDPVAQRCRMVLSAGSPLSAEAARECRRVFGVAPTEIYGSTETGAIASRGDGASWTPLPGAHIRREDDGRLSVRAPWIEGESWRATDDVVERTPDGGFTLLGRTDRVVKIEGKRVSLAGVEAALAALPQVGECTVIALTDCRDQLAAAVVPSPTGRAELDRLGPFRFGRLLRASLAGRLEPLARPRRWRFVDSLPAAALGKRSATAIAALFESPRLPDILAHRPIAAGIELDLAISPELWWFQGHFPGFPILPGVVQLDWVLQLAAAHLGLAVSGRHVQVKYKAPIGPGDRVTLALTHVAAKNRLNFEYRREGQVCSTGQVAAP